MTGVYSLNPVGGRVDKINTTMEDLPNGAKLYQMRDFDIYCRAVFDRESLSKAEWWMGGARKTIEWVAANSDYVSRYELEVEAKKILEWCREDKATHGGLDFDLGYGVLKIGNQRLVARRFWFLGDDDGSISISICKGMEGYQVMKHYVNGCW